MWIQSRCQLRAPRSFTSRTMSFICSAFCRVMTVEIVGAKPASTRLRIPARMRSKDPFPRTASFVAAVAPSRLTWRLSRVAQKPVCNTCRFKFLPRRAGEGRLLRTRRAEEVLWKEVEGYNFFSVTVRGFKFQKSAACVYQGHRGRLPRTVRLRHGRGGTSLPEGSGDRCLHRHAREAVSRTLRGCIRAPGTRGRRAGSARRGLRARVLLADRASDAAGPTRRPWSRAPPWSGNPL